MSLLTDLVSYWKLDEASGTRADAHGSTSLSDVGSVTSATGKINSAATFNGSSQYLSGSDAALPGGGAARSVSFWAKPSSLTGSVFAYGTYSVAAMFEVGIFPGSNKWFFSQYGGLLEGNVASSGVWTHVVATYDGTTVRIYENGSLTASSSSLSIGTALSGVRIAEEPPGGGYKFPGEVDEVGLWSRELTSTEVTDLYNGGSGLAYGSFGGGGGTTYTTSPTGSCTATGALTKLVSKAFAGSETATGALTRTKVALKALAGSATASGAIVKSVLKPVAGTSTAAGALAKQARKAFAGSETPSGALAKQARKTFAGSSTASGVLTRIKVVLKAVAGSCTPSGAMTRVKSATKALAGSVTATGALARAVTKSLAGSSTATGALARARSVAKSFAGSCTPTGALSTVKVVLKALAGAMTAAGALAKRVLKALAGFVTGSGALSTSGGAPALPGGLVGGRVGLAPAIGGAADIAAAVGGSARLFGGAVMGKIYIGEDMTPVWNRATVTDPATGAVSFANAATITYALKDSTGAAVSGGTGSLSYITGSSGNYIGVIESTVTAGLTAGATYYLDYTFAQGGQNGFRREELVAGYHGAAA